MRIALFITCVADTVFPEAGRSTVAVLERLGHDVDFPRDQTCCGQMHANSGYRTEALALGRRLVDAFAGHETIVSPSSSCVGNVRAVLPALAREAGDVALEGDLRALAERTFELSELLVTVLRQEDVGATYRHRVAYHPTCHSLRVTHVGNGPYTLLRHVRGLELVALERADECCGFGGTFSVKNEETSTAMLADKCAEIEASGAEVCAALDSSCLLQIGGGLFRRGSLARAVHLAEILASVE